MRVIKAELEPCPFCGGKAVMMECKVFLSDGVMVECSRCTARQAVKLIDHPKITVNGLDESTRYTRDQAIEKAAGDWNRRAT